MRRSPVPVAVVVLAVLLVGVLAYALVGGNGSNLDSAVQRGERPAVPDGAAALQLPVLGEDGRTQSLEDLRGKVVVVNVWGSWCEPCEDEAPLISEIHDALKKSGEGQVVGVTHVDPTEKSLAFVQKHGLTFPSVRDVEDELYDAFGGTGTPETYVLDKSGRVAALSRGVITPEFANEALQTVGATARVQVPAAGAEGSAS